MGDNSLIELDKTDKAILGYLAENGRLPVSDLAPLVHLSTATCFRRVHRLVDLGVILPFCTLARKSVV